MTASASGKIILLGEHAVVYGMPAIAIPVPSVRTTVSLIDHLGGIILQSPSLGLDTELTELESAHPIRAMFEVIFSQLQIRPCNILIAIDSSIPVASGMGSGAALSAASIKAFAEKFSIPLSTQQLNAICFETEKIFHGNPSGVDNTVITYNLPVYYQPGKAVQPLEVNGVFHFIIANTGIQASTKGVVSDVRLLTQSDPAAMKTIERIGILVDQGQVAIVSGNNNALGALMNQAHVELKKLTVSSLKLDNLVQTALDNGALGAKLSGAGRGGNMIALVNPADINKISASLLSAGAINVIVTILRRPDDRIR